MQNRSYFLIPGMKIYRYIPVYTKTTIFIQVVRIPDVLMAVPVTGSHGPSHSLAARPGRHRGTTTATVTVTVTVTAGVTGRRGRAAAAASLPVTVWQCKTRAVAR
jgi:hypothetical protein